MKQSRHHMADVIGAKTMRISDSKKLAREIAAFVLHERMTDDLQSLMRDIIQYRADHGVVEAIAVSVSPLTEQVKKDIKHLIKAEYPKTETIIVDEKQDPAVVGGLRIDLANEQLDLSVKAKLNKFKRLTALERSKA